MRPGGARPGRDLERDDLGQPGRRRPDRRHEVAAPVARDCVPAGQVVPVRCQPLRVRPTIQEDPPQLVAPVDRGREQHGRPVGGHGQPRLLAQGHVAGHPRVGLELARGQQVRPASPARVRTVRREPPDPGPVPAPRDPLPDRDDRGPVSCPRRRPEQRVIARCNGRDVTGGHLDGEDHRALREVRVPPAVRRERDPRPVRGPGRGRLGRGAGDQRSRRAGRHVHEPQVGVRVVDETGAVVLVAEPVEVAVIGERRLAGLGLPGPAPLPRVRLLRGPQGGGKHRERAAVRRPGEPGHAAREVREPPRLAAFERQQVDLDRVEALPGLRRPVGLLLHQQPAIGEERERRAIRREPGAAVRARAEGEPASPAGPVDGRRPDRMPVAVEPDGARPDGECDRPAVGRQARIERDLEAVDVIGACGSGHEHPPDGHD